MWKGRVCHFKVNLRVGEVRTGIERVADATMDKFADEVILEARVRSRVDTGFQRASIYKVTRLGDTYQKALREARALNPKASFEGRMRKLPGFGRAMVVCGANYSLFNELREPFMVPAKAAAIAKMAKILEAAGRTEFGR